MRLPISDFWELTLKEYLLIVDGYQNSIKLQRDLVITQAYLISRWVRANKLPPLDKLLKEKEEPKQHKQMTDDEMMKTCIMLNKMFGGEEVCTDG